MKGALEELNKNVNAVREDLLKGAVKAIDEKKEDEARTKLAGGKWLSRASDMIVNGAKAIGIDIIAKKVKK